MNENENTNNNSEFSNINNQPMEQLAPLEDNESKNEIQVVTQTEQSMLMSVQEFVPGTMRSYIESDIQRLNERHNNSVGELKKNGSLSPELIKKSDKLLSSLSMDVASLTPNQAIKLYDFAMETTSEAKYKKGEKLYRLLNQSVDTRNYYAIESRRTVEQRKLDQNPEVGDYFRSDFRDRESDLNESKIMAGIIERFDEAYCRFEGVDYDLYTKKKSRLDTSRDPFSQSIGRIAASAIENRENGVTLTEDNIDIGVDRDLQWAMNRSEEYFGDDDDEDENGLVYGIYKESDMEFARDTIDLRNDISMSSNNQHSEKIKEIYTEGFVSDIIDHLNVSYIEEIISENRLTAKSAVVLGVAVMERALSMKDKNTPNLAKINLLMSRTESLCKQLLNISTEKNIENKNDSCKYLMEKCEKRRSGIWDKVNRGAKNYTKVDFLLQSAHELGVMLDLSSENNGNLLDNGNDF